MVKDSKKSSKTGKDSKNLTTPLDISKQIAEWIDIAGKPTRLKPLNGNTDFRRAFVVGEIDDSGRLRERVVYCCFWKDMRSVPDEGLPAISGPTYSLWSVEADTDDRQQAGSNTFMGMLYHTPDGQTVLTRPRTDRDAEIDGFIAQADRECVDCNSDGLAEAIGDDGDGTILISTTNCERSRPVTLSAYVYSSYDTTGASAIIAAVANAQVYADDVARGRGRLESCGAGCRSCSSGSANVTITKRDSSVFLLAALFYAGWRYTGYVEFDYSFRVGCCRTGLV